MLKVKVFLNAEDQCYHVHLFILRSPNSHGIFHTIFTYRAFYFPTCILTLYFSYFSFFLINNNQKQVFLIKLVNLVFVKGLSRAS